MTLEELIKQLERAQEKATKREWQAEGRYFVDRSTQQIQSMGVAKTDEDAQAIADRHNTAHDVLVYLRAIQMLDRKGKMTADDAPNSYGMLNVLRVLWDLGLNDNMGDPGAGDYADQLAGHLQQAFEAGRRGRTE